MTHQPTGNLGSPHSPPPGRGKRIGLLVAGIVVLILVALIVVLVIRPWDDGNSTKDTGSQDDPPAGGITGDINDDGYGDAVAMFFDIEGLEGTGQVWTSTGSSFGAPTPDERPSTAFEDPLIGDWDGDGARTVIGWDRNARTIRAWDDSFESIGVAETVGEDDLALVAGDFDGDGRTDLATYNGDVDGEITVYVLLGNGAGFDAPAAWATVDGLEGSFGTLVPGDFDDDGADDLIAFVDTAFNGTGEESADARDLVALTSTGSSFDVGEVAAAPDADMEDVLVGDFDGSGTPQVLSQDYDDDRTYVRHFSWDGTALQENVEFEAETPLNVSVSDVDGDGLDDLVGIGGDEDGGYSELVVLLSTGSGFSPAETWGDVPDCGGCTAWMARGI